jgi:hypothetical protein
MTYERGFPRRKTGAEARKRAEILWSTGLNPGTRPRPNVPALTSVRRHDHESRNKKYARDGYLEWGLKRLWLCIWGQDCLKAPGEERTLCY